MKATIFPQRYPLHRPFRSSGWEIAVRDVLLLRLDDEAGHTGWGEAAPLPLFGTESLDQSWAMLREISEAESMRRIDARGQLEDIDAIFPALAAAPTARFALESALLDMRARQQDVSLAQLLGEASPRNRIPVNAVAGGGSPAEAAAAASAASRQGYRCIKMKVGAADPDEDAARLRALRLAVPAEMSVRLDANGAWYFNTAEHAMRLFAPYGIEYIEQPVAAEDVDELTALTGLGIIPVAADEAAQRLDDARLLLQRRGVDVLVIKPMAAGGLRSVRELACQAQAMGVDVVLTSFIDSAVGRNAVAQLCASLPFPLRHQGLSTGSLFALDSGRDTVVEGELRLAGGAGTGMQPELEAAS